MKPRSYVVIIFATVMIAQTLLILTWGEPYPSIAMPRVSGTVTQKDTIAESRRLLVVQTDSKQRKVVSTSEIFSHATVGRYLGKHIQYKEGPYLSQATKQKVRKWLVKRLKDTGISEIRSIHMVSTEIRYPICRRCDHSNIERDTSSSVLLFQKR